MERIGDSLQHLPFDLAQVRVRHLGPLGELTQGGPAKLALHADETAEAALRIVHAREGT
jgi:hypothetical protein